MRIRTKISLLVSTLIVFVVGSVTANLFWLEQRRVRADFSERVDAMLDGITRISREALKVQDELMLLGYLKGLMQDYPEIELVIVSRQGHVSLIGGVKTELLYRTLTVAEKNAAGVRTSGKAGSLEPSSNDVPAEMAAASRTIPPNTYVIQIGLSKSLLDGQIRKAQKAMAARVAALTLVGLILGVIGSLWLGRLLARPVAALAAAAEDIGKGKLDTIVEAKGRDEIAALGVQFNRMTSRLREFIRFKEELFGTLSHDLNTPLSGLKGFLDYLQGTDITDPEKLREDYQLMSEALQQMEISLKNALDLFVTSTRPSLHVEPLCVNDLIAEAMRLFAPLAQTSGVELKGPIGPSSTHISADREMMRRVFINLISNGLKFTPPGGMVTISLESEADGIKISVADTGLGIAPEDLERIFTEFYRASGPNGRVHRIAGSGLGLAIAKQAVDMQKGRIWVESEVGQGSVFHVYMPKQVEGV